MRSEADIWAALGEVIHPTYGMSLVTLQMVQAIRITPDCIEVDLVMNCPGCPAGKVALARAREVVDSWRKRWACPATYFPITRESSAKPVWFIRDVTW